LAIWSRIDLGVTSGKPLIARTASVGFFQPRLVSTRDSQKLVPIDVAKATVNPKRPIYDPKAGSGWSQRLPSFPCRALVPHLASGLLL